MNFDLDDLAVFLAVIGTGSFHRAAQQRALSQPAVTRRIKKLEAALDTPLFERTTRQVKPTLAAKRLRPRAEALLADAQEAARALRDETAAFAAQQTAILTVATIATAIPDLVAPALQDLPQATRVRLLDGAANTVAEAVAEGEADLGITSLPAMQPGLQLEPLFQDRLVLVLPSGHGLAGRSALAWGDLSGARLILPARGTGNRVLIDDALARSGGGPAWQVETERSTTALALVESGAGVAVLPLSLVRRLTSVAWRPLRAPQIARPLGILTRVGAAERPAAATLKSALRRVAAELRQG